VCVECVECALLMHPMQPRSWRCSHVQAGNKGKLGQTAFCRCVNVVTPPYIWPVESTPELLIGDRSNTSLEHYLVVPGTVPVSGPTERGVALSVSGTRRQQKIQPCEGIH